MSLPELLPFLHDNNPAVRAAALAALLGHTDAHAPARSLFLADPVPVRDLKQLCRDHTTTAHDAFVALVNLSDAPALADALAEPAFLAFLLSYVINPKSKLADLAAMLLSNISRSPAIAARIVRLTIPVHFIPWTFPPLSRCASSDAPAPELLSKEAPQKVLALPLLVDAFVQGASPIRSREGSLHFLSSVFANISMIPEGRLFFFTPSSANPGSPLEFPLSKIILFTEHADTIRRGGAASTIKNCCFVEAAHQAILSPLSVSLSVPPSTQEAPGVDALQYILLPLAGPEELDLEAQESLPESLQLLPPDKAREKDAVLRLTHVESLLLLCATRWARQFLRSHGVYEVVRTCHLEEDDPKVASHIEDLVNLLKRDEPPELKNEDVNNDNHQDDSGDDIIEEI